jgi:hypothetical protein
MSWNEGGGFEGCVVTMILMARQDQDNTRRETLATCADVLLALARGEVHSGGLGRGGRGGGQQPEERWEEPLWLYPRPILGKGMVSLR